MAVFVAASDESSGAGLYHYAGWLAPEPDWSLYFTPAWQDRVLNGPPKIPYLHMTEMRSKAYRAKWGLSELEADDRLDEAARVIDTLGSLYPFKLTIDSSIFSPLYKPHKMIVESGAWKEFKPDFLAFTAYVFAVLCQVNFKYPEAEKVDFLVENNSEITKHIHELYKTMPVALNHIKRPDLVPLLGEFIPGGKDRVPLQAADYLCWHSQRADAQTLDDERDLRRWNTISHRKGFNLPLPMDVLTKLAESFTKHGKEEHETTKRIRQIRHNDATVNAGSAQRDKSRTGRGKGRKKQAAQKKRVAS